MNIDVCLKNILSIVSPSGYEHRIVRVLKEYVSDYVDSITEDAIGNLICTKYGKDPQTNKTTMFVQWQR